MTYARRRLARVLDASALVALFDAHEPLMTLLRQAEQGAANLFLPAACMAEAEGQVRAGVSGWEAILLTPGLVPLDLSSGIAVAIGQWPGTLGARHAVYEQTALRAMVVTTTPAAYEGLAVTLLAV